MAKYFHNMQDLTSDCGIAVTKSLVQYYHRFNVETFESVISGININQGLSLLDIEDILKSFGIEGSSYEVDDLSLLDFKIPMILVIDNNGENHYILSYSIEGENIIISNPIHSKIERIHLSDLEKLFKGYIFRVEDRMRRESNDALNFKHRYNKISSYGISKDFMYLTTITWMLPIVIVFSIQYFLIYQLRNLEIWHILIIVIFEFLLIGIYIKAKIEQDVLLSEESALNQENLTLSFLEEIDEITESEDNIYNRLIQFWSNFNASDWQLKRGLAFLELFYAILMLLSTVLFSKEVTILSFICAVGFISLYNKENKKRRNLNKMHLNTIGELSIFVEEAIHNKLDRRIFSNNKEVREYLRNILLKIKATDYEQRKAKTKIATIYDSVMYINLLLIFIYIVLMHVFEVDIKISEIFISFVIVYIMYGLGKSVLQKFLELERYSSLNSGKQSYFNNKDIIWGKFNITGIVLSNIIVTYDTDKPISILNGITKEFKDNGLILIKGKNGIGKSTLLQVIIGAVSVSQGKVSYYDSDSILDSYPIEVIQNRMSYYHSNQFLNYASIEKNISYSLYKNIKNPVDNIFDLELEKVVFYNGINLSQGERQKVLLSRTLNKEADVYLFDEPMSNLDGESKKILMDKIMELKQKSIVFIVTHDSQFDRISDDIINLGEA